MSSKPRNPSYFPRMKVRGARRRRLAPFQRATGSFLRLNGTMREAAEAMRRLAVLVNDAEVIVHE